MQHSSFEIREMRPDDEKTVEYLLYNISFLGHVKQIVWRIITSKLFISLDVLLMAILYNRMDNSVNAILLGAFLVPYGLYEVFPKLYAYWWFYSRDPVKDLKTSIYYYWIRAHIDTMKLWVATVNGTIIACMAVRPVNVLGMPNAFHSAPDKDVAVLERMIVHPKLQRRGIGNRLLEHVIDFSRISGVKELHLSVSKHRMAARKLFESYGFQKQLGSSTVLLGFDEMFMYQLKL